jgi:5-formyltetrahydrofolate cyclo-ligase
MRRSAPRHDRDAGGPADVLAAKAALPAGGDVPVDFIITPERVIDCRPRHGPRPTAGISWADLTEEKIAAIPLLAAQRAAAR